MALNITVNGAGTFTASMEEGPVSFSASLGAIGPKGDTGDTGPSGVVAATAPVTYDSGTQTVGIDTAYFVRSPAVSATDGQILSWDGATSRPLWIANDARTLFLTAVNKTGTTIAKGKAVYISGATGNKPEITLAQANTEAASSKTIGITTAAIANNGTGTVVVAGLAEGLDTSAFPEGQGLYLSPTSAGDFVTSLPTQPNHGVFIGVVTRSNNSNGSIEVHIQNYQELEELSDVLVSGKANLDLLSWDSATSVWKNKTFSALGLLTSSTAAATYAPIVHTHTASQISDSTSAGRALLTAADAAAQRTSLGLGTMAVESASSYYLASNPSGYVTAATAPVTSVAGKTGAVSLAVADVSGAAPLSSPTFTGTPSLPTGTIAVTQAAGNSTTAVATTAFVQQEVPTASTTAAGKVELATDLEGLAGTSTSLASTPFAVSFNTAEPSYYRLITGLTFAATSGTGATTGNDHFGATLSSGTTSTGYAVMRFRALANSSMTTVGNTFGVVSFSKPMLLSAKLVNGGAGTISNNCNVRLTIGKGGTAINGDLANRGFGVKYSGVGALILTVHNGTTLTDVTSSYTPSLGECFRVAIYSDGAGNVTLYVNGSSVATTSSGPTGAAAQYQSSVFIEIENTGTPTGSPGVGFNGGALRIFD